MKKYKIEIILDKEEISPDFKIICYSEIYIGEKKNAILRARALQKEWKAEYYTLTLMNERKK